MRAWSSAVRQLTVFFPSSRQDNRHQSENPEASFQLASSSLKIWTVFPLIRCPSSPAHKSPLQYAFIGHCRTRACRRSPLMCVSQNCRTRRSVMRKVQCPTKQTLFSSIHEYKSRCSPRNARGNWKALSPTP